MNIKLNLICEVPQNNNVAEKYLEAACEKNNIECKKYVADTTELSKLKSLGLDDLLYRIEIGEPAITIERLLMSGECTHFHAEWNGVYRIRSTSWYLHEKLGFPVIPSYPGIPSTSEELDMVTEMLGQFPIIIKVVGGSLGIGVMRADSLASLRSILDYLRSLKANVLLRKYIEHDHAVKAIVVGDKMVASYATYVSKTGFRTNASERAGRREEIQLSDEIQKMTIEATKALGIEFGSVDLIFDKDEQPLIAEINFPCNFAPAQDATGVDIADAMVKYLIQKSERSVHSSE